MELKPKPRAKYFFGQMKKGEVMVVVIPKANPLAGEQARNAAYAYSRTHPKLKFCTGQEKVGAKRVMLIRRLK